MYSAYTRHKKTQEECCRVIKKFFIPDEKTGEDERGFFLDTIEHLQSKKLSGKHVMPFSPYRALMSSLSMLKFGIGKVIEYNDAHPDFPMKDDNLRRSMERYIAYATLWGFCGDMPLKERIEVGDYLQSITNAIEFPPHPLIDYEPRMDKHEGEWKLWSTRVQTKELSSDKVNKPDCVIQTTDTIRHADVAGSWLADHRPLILCGPPGSGKSMTLVSLLNAMPDFELVTLNFSSSSDVDLIQNVLTHYCDCTKTPKGMVMRPSFQNKWCDFL
eukprot:TRINITY_DN1742_c0_g1_i1.p1 TRINITY_DN1742_c0_g1~~TRINITY_DN1742_c0_g1_i1.p1  ORF type:complete len:272 (+),score=40.68 TRINITY_DN1742_c0_g1_i1:93-908(+)